MSLATRGYLECFGLQIVQSCARLRGLNKLCHEFSVISAARHLSVYGGLNSIATVKHFLGITPGMQYDVVKWVLPVGSLSSRALWTLIKKKSIDAVHDFMVVGIGGILLVKLVIVGKLS